MRREIVASLIERDSMKDDRPIQLEYAAVVPWSQRPLPIKLTTRIAIAVGVIAAGIALREPIGQRLEIVRLERQCGTNVMPTDAIFYSDITRSLNSPPRTAMDQYLRTAPVQFIWPAGSDAIFGHWLRSPG